MLPEKKDIFNFSYQNMQMTNNEKKYLKETLLTKKKYLEIGSGFSTIWFSQFVSELHSVECRTEWFKEIGKYIKSNDINNVTIWCFPPEKNAYYSDGTEKWNRRDSIEGSDYGTIEEFYTYFWCVKNLINTIDFDVILVDANIRKEIIELLIELGFAGTILLHDVVPERRYLNDSILNLSGIKVVNVVDSLVSLQLDK